jgi:hypothetical protein
MTTAAIAGDLRNFHIFSQWVGAMAIDVIVRAERL